jgi:ADP-ribose pyrophosphatase YjhB (NUDIX family)
VPTLGVQIAIVADGEVLLIKRRDFEVWALPGGGVDDGESAAEAAVREAREETGLEVELQHLVGVYSHPDWCRGGDHDLLFRARPVGGELAREGDETLDAGFFPPDTLPEPFIHLDRRRIADTLSGTRGLACRQLAPWPFAGAEDLGDLRRQLAAGAMTLEEIKTLFAATEADADRIETND